jgi:hypothetical protein
MKKYTLELTKLEIQALLETAGQMRDDIDDYYSFMAKKEKKDFINAYNTSIQKLQDQWQKTN